MGCAFTHSVPPGNLESEEHGFGIRLSQIGARQIDGHHELKFQPATQIVQEGVVSLVGLFMIGVQLLKEHG